MSDGMKNGVGDDPFADDVQDDVEATDEAVPSDDSVPEQTEYSFAGDVVEAIEAIEDGTENKNISIRDRDLKALLLVLEENYEARYNVTDALALEEDAPRSDIVRKLLRVGLAGAAPTVHEALGEGIAEHARDSV